MSEELDSTRILVEQKNYNETWETERVINVFRGVIIMMNMKFNLDKVGGEE